ncbi:TPA: hypothetical protein J1383_001638 [Escherichia coli]|nr:hypothetical protein [Escherichia coli]HBA9458452.1 hypothetical protein [Escherichia coli]
MSKNKPTTDIFAEQRQKLLHAIIERKQEVKKSSQPEITASKSPKHFAIEDFLKDHSRKMRSGHVRPPH